MYDIVNKIKTSASTDDLGPIRCQRLPNVESMTYYIVDTTEGYGVVTGSKRHVETEPDIINHDFDIVEMLVVSMAWSVFVFVYNKLIILKSFLQHII